MAGKDQRTRKKLKHLLDRHTPGTVCLSSWLESQGISHDLQKYYRRAGWLESVGRSAYRRPNEKIGWEGAVHALQNQAGKKLHLGAMTALAVFGSSQNIRFGVQRADIFSPPTLRLPTWFLNYDWGVKINHVNTGFLPQGLAVRQAPSTEFYKFGLSFNLEVSEPERAIFECLYLSPRHQDLLETYQILETLVNLRHKVIQELLEECRSIKVKRLFLYMAKKANHNWFPYIDTRKTDLGSGDRSIVPSGVYISEFRISVPMELTLL